MRRRNGRDGKKKKNGGGLLGHERMVATFLQGPCSPLSSFGASFPSKLSCVKNNKNVKKMVGWLVGTVVVVAVVVVLVVVAVVAVVAVVVVQKTRKKSCRLARVE